MNDFCAKPSAQLLEANRRLCALREQLPGQQQSRISDLPWQANEVCGRDAIRERLTTLPGHLGWGSVALTAVLRRQQQNTACVDDQDVPLEEMRKWVDCGEQTAVAHSARSNSPSSGWVKLYPDIGLGMLRQEMTAPGRLWLMLRYLDKDGRGVLRIDITTKLLTTKSSELRLCGRRQLRNLLRDGEGVFWTRDKERIWLRSTAKVALSLSVARLTGQPVALPLSALVDGIGDFRAHLYVAFHSGRMKETPYGAQARPIARETLAALSGVGRSSQRTYETCVGLSVQHNFAVGPLEQKERKENQAWEKGRALFELRDQCGQQGSPGRTYLAWQLPNSYIGQHQQRPKGRQKRINRELNVLVMKGMPGNVAEAAESPMVEKRYYLNGKLAAQAHGRHPEHELYWQRRGVGVENGRFALWHSMAA